MIKKLSSKQMMDTFDEAESRLETLRESTDAMRLELNKKIKVFEDSIEFATTSLNKYNEYLLTKERINNNTTILSEPDIIIYGKYDAYGISVGPQSVSKQVNVFNIMSPTGAIYKANANIYINSKVANDHTGMLMHDSIKAKTMSYEEFDTSDITLRIEVNPGNLLGATNFNQLEFLPQLPGSFDIRQIRIFTMQDYMNKSENPSFNKSVSIPSVGPSRFLFEDSHNLYALELDIHLNFQNGNNKFPFGMRHIYFLQSNFNPSSSVILKLTREKYIDYISDKIILHDQNGIRNTTCTEEHIKLYAAYSNGVLSQEITTTKGVVPNTISWNIHDIYLEIPLTKNIVSLKFNTISER